MNCPKKFVDTSRLLVNKAQHNKAVQLTPNFIVSRDLLLGVLPQGLALTGTTFAGYGVTDGCR